MRRTRPPEDRFWEKVDKDGPVPDYAPHLGPCWLWTASLSIGGYGNFTVTGGRYIVAHRWAYQHFVGPVPEGLQLDHLCRVRRCVNPSHLEPVTNKENLRRGIGSGSATHCPHGRPYSGENLYRAKGDGHRMCRACNRDRRLARQARARLALAGEHDG